MTIVLDNSRLNPPASNLGHHKAIRIGNHALGEKGRFKQPVPFDLNITAKEAQRKVDRWLHQQVSMLISADPPTLVVGKRTVWSVPAYISFPHVGRVGVVGTVSVDAQSGEMRELARCKVEIERYLEEKVKPNLPPYKPHTLSAKLYPKAYPPSTEVDFAR